VLFWGALKLYREAVSIKRFLLACVLPAPFLIYWIITAILSGSDGGPSSQRLTASLEKALYEPFKRPEGDKGVSYKLLVFVHRILIKNVEQTAVINILKTCIL